MALILKFKFKKISTKHVNLLSTYFGTTLFEWNNQWLVHQPYIHIQCCAIIIIINIQCCAIRCEFELVGPILFKDSLGVRWGLLLTLCLVDSWCFHQVGRRFYGRESNCQTLRSDLSTFALSSGSSWSSQTHLQSP